MSPRLPSSGGSTRRRRTTIGNTMAGTDGRGRATDGRAANSAIPMTYCTEYQTWSNTFEPEIRSWQMFWTRWMPNRRFGGSNGVSRPGVTTFYPRDHLRHITFSRNLRRTWQRGGRGGENCAWKSNGLGIKRGRSRRAPISADGTASPREISLLHVKIGRCSRCVWKIIKGEGVKERRCK